MAWQFAGSLAAVAILVFLAWKVLLVPAGAHFIARLLGPGIEVARDGGELTLRGRDLSIRLELGPHADDWAKAIARLG